MVLSSSDKAIIEACYLEKGWCGKQICKEFPSKQWKMTTVNDLIRKIKSTGSSARNKRISIRNDNLGGLT